MMEGEEFDEFEEATYSHSQPEQQQAATAAPIATHALAGLDLLHDSHIAEPIHSQHANQSPPLELGSLEKHSADQEEPVWPQLSKASSAHATSGQAFMADFSKSYSLTEQANKPITQDFLGFDFSAHSQPQTLHFTQQEPSDILSSHHAASVPSLNTDFLMQISPPQAELASFGLESAKVASQEEEGKVEVSQNTNQFNAGTNLYATSNLNAANEFDLFAPMAENTKASSQKQAKVESQEPNPIIVENTDSLFQFNPSPPQQKFSFDYAIQKPAQQKKEQQEDDWMEAYSSPPTSTPYVGLQQTQPEIVEDVGQGVVKVEEADRKESEEFEFHEAQPAQSIPEPEPRKQSEEFVFEAQQPSLPTAQPTNNAEIEQFGQQYQSTQQQFHAAQLQQEPQPVFAQQPIEASRQEIGQKEEKEQAGQPEEEEDEFGDFEETPAVEQPEPESVTSNGFGEADNTVRINEEYLSSAEGDFYRGRQAELQQLVDSLPDYSFLFAKAFLA